VIVVRELCVLAVFIVLPSSLSVLALAAVIITVVHRRAFGGAKDFVAGLSG